MHSEKIDYKNEIYKPLLKIGLMEDYNLVLPMSDKYISNYIKDLIKECDVVLCNLTKFNMFANIELKTAKKLNKDIYYFIKETDKSIKKYNNINPIIYKNSEEYSLQVKKILNNLNHKDLFLKRDNIYSLGKIVKKKYN